MRKSVCVPLCFRLEIAFTGKTTGIMVKSSKMLHEALSAVLHKHHLKQQDALVTVVSPLMYEGHHIMSHVVIYCLALQQYWTK